MKDCHDPGSEASEDTLRPDGVPHPVPGFESEMIRGTTRTTFTVVDHGTPDIEDSKSRGSSPASVVDLFAIEKEAFVPGSHCVIACR